MQLQNAGQGMLQVTQSGIFTGHRAAVFALAEAADLGCFYSADGNGWVVKWNTATPDLGQAIAQVPSNVFALQYLPQNNLLAVGSMQGALYFINLNQNRVLEPPLQWSKSVFCMQTQGSRLYVGTGIGELWVINLQTLQPHTFTTICQHSIRSMHLHPHLPLMALGCSNHQIYLLHTHTGKIVQELTYHQNSVFSVRFSPDGNYLLSGSRDAYLAVWQINPNGVVALLHTIPAHLFTINSLTFLPPGALFASAARDKTVKIWHATSFDLLKVIDSAKQEWQAHKNSVNSLLWLPHNNLLLSAGDDRQIFAWQIEV